MLTPWFLVFKILLPKAELILLLGVTVTERTCVWKVLSCCRVSRLGTRLIPAEIAFEYDLRLPPVSFVIFQVIFPWKVNRRRLCWISWLGVCLCGFAPCAVFVCWCRSVCFAQLGLETCLAVEVFSRLCAGGYFWASVLVCDSQAGTNDWEMLQMNGWVCLFPVAVVAN